MFSENRVFRRISLLLVASYLSLITQPLQAALQQEIYARPKPGTEHSTSQGELERLRELTRELALQRRLTAQTAPGLLDQAKALAGVDAGREQDRRYAEKS